LDAAASLDAAFLALLMLSMLPVLNPATYADLKAAVFWCFCSCGFVCRCLHLLLLLSLQFWMILFLLFPALFYLRGFGCLPLCGIWRFCPRGI
jgi:hypothetical protein